MGHRHTAFQRDGLAIACKLEVGFPVASPADGSNQAMIACLQIEKRQRGGIRRISVERLHMGASARTERFFERFEVVGSGIAAASMAEHDCRHRKPRWIRPTARCFPEWAYRRNRRCESESPSPQHRGNQDTREHRPSRSDELPDLCRWFGESRLLGRQ